MNAPGYVTTDKKSGDVKFVELATVRVVVLSDFIGPDHKILSAGELVTLPRALALTQIRYGFARPLTREEIAREESSREAKPRTLKRSAK